MQNKTIEEIEQEYDLELEKIILKIKKDKAKRVLLQFPDGLKRYATTIVDYLESKTEKTTFFIWLGSCFGACDVPKADVDLVIQFGHSAWKN